MSRRQLLNKLTPVIRPFCNAKTKRLIDRRQGFGDYRHLEKAFRKVHP